MNKSMLTFRGTEKSSKEECKSSKHISCNTENSIVHSDINSNDFDIILQSTPNHFRHNQSCSLTTKTPKELINNKRVNDSTSKQVYIEFMT
jgi:hypothetical protein